MKANSLSISIASGGDEAEMEMLLENATFQVCLEQAETCCEQARLAARCRRYKSACGLFETAISLYKRALTLEGIGYPAIENRLRDIETEMAVYAELGRSMSRPLVKR